MNRKNKMKNEKHSLHSLQINKYIYKLLILLYFFVERLLPYKFTTSLQDSLQSIRKITILDATFAIVEREAMTVRKEAEGYF